MVDVVILVLTGSIVLMDIALAEQSGVLILKRELQFVVVLENIALMVSALSKAENDVRL